MNILIDNKSNTPIYEQIYAQIKAQIIAGALRKDELLPSIRGFAKDLRVSVITTRRAYDELERAGFLYTIPGKGSFVAKNNVERLREEQRRNVEESLRASVRLAAECGVSRGEVIEMIKQMMGERK